MPGSSGPGGYISCWRPESTTTGPPGVPATSNISEKIPFLAARLVVPFIRGVQQGGVIATVKHFVGNDQEFDRYRVSTEVSERALREIYLPPFRAAVQEAGVKAVMTGYNLVNGTYMSEHPLLTDLLRKEWGFDGILMPDWSSVHSARAICSDLDLEMGSNR